MNKTIKIAGRELPCRVTMGAMLRFENATGHDVKDMNSAKISELVCFLFCCVSAACNADGIPFDMDQQTFADHLEPDAVDNFNAMMAAPAEKKAKPGKPAPKTPA